MEEMEVKCLDTDFLVAILRGKDEALDKLDELENISITLTSVNAFELYYGAHKSAKSVENMKQLKTLLASYDLLLLDGRSAEKAAEIHARLGGRGASIDMRDCLIAGIALANGVKTIVSRNIKHFSRVPGLKVERW